jgi:hypothetical protein
MIVAAGFFVTGVVCSLALIIRELRKAPEGYEDEHGFYTVRKGAVKYGVPGSMKARRTRSSLNWACTARPRIKAFRVRGYPFSQESLLTNWRAQFVDGHHGWIICHPAIRNEF